MALTDPQIQDIVNRVIEALHGLAPLPPSEPSGWVIVSSLAPVAALLAAGLVTYIGWRNLKHQQTALKASMSNDDRSEWWRRTQWALESAASTDEKLNAAGTEMIRLLSKSTMASAEDKNLLDTVWQAIPALVDEESAEEWEHYADDFDNAVNLDESPETGDNVVTKEADHG